MDASFERETKMNVNREAFVTISAKTNSTSACFFANPNTGLPLMPDGSNSISGVGLKDKQPTYLGVGFLSPNCILQSTIVIGFKVDGISETRVSDGERKNWNFRNFKSYIIPFRLEALLDKW